MSKRRLQLAYNCGGEIHPDRLPILELGTADGEHRVTGAPPPSSNAFLSGGLELEVIVVNAEANPTIRGVEAMMKQHTLTFPSIWGSCRMLRYA